MYQEHYFNFGDLVVILENKHIKKEYHNKLAKVIFWHHDNIYTVKVDETGKEIVLNGKEMCLA